MRASQFITEIERLSPGDYEGGKHYLQHAPRNDKIYKLLPGDSGLKYAVEGNDSRAIYIIDDTPNHAGANAEYVPQERRPWDSPAGYRARERDNLAFFNANKTKTIVGKLTLYRKRKLFKNGYQVSTITVHEDYRSRGIAKALYGIALSILKFTLISGGSQTPGGRRNWMSLASIPGVEVKGLVEIDNDLLTSDKPHKSADAREKRFAVQQNKEVDQTINALIKLGGQYISGNPRDKHGETYWAFDVVGGNGELAPAVKTKLSQIYSNSYGDNSLLYAQWTGNK